jgi:flagellar export protein FliJ
MFKFRLEKVLDYRKRLEEAAKRKFIERKAERISCEGEIEAVRARRKELGRAAGSSVVTRLELGAHFAKADDDENVAKIALGVLLDEEAAAEREWIHAKRELQVIEKLRENRLAEWQLEDSRRAQNELDEWAVLRRSSSAFGVKA